MISSCPLPLSFELFQLLPDNGCHANRSVAIDRLSENNRIKVAPQIIARGESTAPHPRCALTSQLQNKT